MLSVPDPDRRPRLPAWVERVAGFGASEADSEDERVAKAVLIAVTLLIMVLALVWVVTYLALGRIAAALIPLGYQVASVATLVVFSRTKSLPFLQTSQLSMMLLLPFFLQWTLGGFANSSGVALWAAVAAALSRFVGARAWPWVGGFFLLIGVSLIVDSAQAEAVAPLPSGVVTSFFGLNIAAVTLVVFFGIDYFVRERDRFRQALRVERERAERLLLNVLPGPIAERLKRGETPIVDSVPQVSVLFADIVDFTPTSGTMAPEQVVGFLGELFSDLDELARHHGLTPIKTLGDGYMAVGGLFEPAADHTAAVVDMALAMRDQISGRPFGPGELVFRIGVDVGPAVAAVVGSRKFSYDLWGDPVNVASRMESHGIPGEIQVTDRVRSLVADAYSFRLRPQVDVKGLGTMDAYILEERRDDAGAG